MILFIERIGGDKSRESYRLNKPADFEPLFEEYPETRGIAMLSESLESAAEGVCQYLSRHHLDAWTEGDGLSKGIRNAALGLGMAAASALGPMAQAAPLAPPAGNMPQAPLASPAPSPTPSLGLDEPAFGSQPEDKFLWNIAQVESANGKNTNHRRIVHGKYAGNTAIGRWGMLKPTVMEMLGRMKDIGPLKPDYAPLETMSRDQIAKQFRENPGVELGLARYIAKHVLHRQRGNRYRSAYAWTMGHNLYPHEINPKDLEGHFYVEAYKRAEKKNPFKAQAVKKLRHHVTMNDPAMMKAEGKTDFKARLGRWKVKRDEDARSRPFEDSSHSYDPGRIRDDKEIEGPKSHNDGVKRALKQMSEGRK